MERSNDRYTLLASVTRQWVFQDLNLLPNSLSYRGDPSGTLSSCGQIESLLLVLSIAQQSFILTLISHPTSESDAKQFVRGVQTIISNSYISAPCKLITICRALRFLETVAGDMFPGIMQEEFWEIVGDSCE